MTESDASRDAALQITDLHRRVIIIDDFYEDPDRVRDMALRADYGMDQAYPGRRSPVFSAPDFVRKNLERYVGKPILDIQSLFQIQPEAFEKDSFVHGDLCDWSGILYLNKDREGTPGTSFFIHKETGLDTLPIGPDLLFMAIERGVKPDDILAPLARDRFDLDKWTNHITVPIRYNRMIIFNARLFHRNSSAWGTKPADARLVHAYFMLTEKKGGVSVAGIKVIRVPPGQTVEAKT